MLHRRVNRICFWRVGGSHRKLPPISFLGSVGEYKECSEYKEFSDFKEFKECKEHWNLCLVLNL